MHLIIYGESLRFFYIVLLSLDVTRCNLRSVQYILMFILLDLSVPLPGSSLPFTLLGQWLYHNTGIFQQCSVVILILFIPLFSCFFSRSAYGYSLHILVGSWGMVNVVVVLIFVLKLMACCTYASWHGYLYLAFLMVPI